MNQKSQFMTQVYRNSIYQGNFNKENESRQGFGILYDVYNHIIIGSNWSLDQANGPTFIYYRQGNYLYGYWKNNKPQGFNLLRLGSMLVMAFYHDGIIIGNLLVLFQKYNLAVTVCINSQNGKDQFSVESKAEVYSDQDFHNFVSSSGWNTFQQNWKTMIKFLSANFDQQGVVKTPRLKLRLVNKKYYRFGYDEGNAFIFDDEYNLISMGFHKKSKIDWLGLRRTKENYYQQGNFDNLQKIVAYNYAKNRPHKKINKIYTEQLLKQVNFQNRWPQDPGKPIIKYFTQLAQCNFFKSLLSGQITSRKLDISYQSPYSSEKKNQLYPQMINLLEIPAQNAYNSNQKVDFISNKLSNVQKNQIRQLSESRKQIDDYETQKDRLKKYEKQILNQLQKRKNRNNYEEIGMKQQTGQQRFIINKAPVLMKSNNKTRKTQMINITKQKQKIRQRSPIFTPQKQNKAKYQISQSPSPLKKDLSPFREKMKNKMFKNQQKREAYVYQPIINKQTQKQFKLFTPEEKYQQQYASPYKQIQIDNSKGQSHYQNSIGNMVPLSLQQNKSIKKKINSNSVYIQGQHNNKKYKKSSADLRDETPQFIPIQGEVGDKSNHKHPKINQNNIYLENIKNKSPDYDHKMQRSKPKTYLAQYQRQRSMSKKDINHDNTHSAKKYDRTIRIFNESNKIHEIINSPKNNQNRQQFKLSPYSKYPKQQSHTKRGQYQYYFD